MSLDNLRRVLAQAGESEIRIAQQAFPKYNKIVTALAAKHGFSAEIGAAVFSALSPNNDYYGNLRDTSRLMEAAANQRDLTSFKVSTYGNNKRKAWRIAHGEPPLDLIVSDKTRNFFLNINNPYDPMPVTIDGHMFNMWLGQRVNLVGLRVPKSLYYTVADGVRTLAQETGYLPCEVQGILWYTHRRIHNILRSSQLTLWDVDWDYAGFDGTRL